jgi:acetyltransferase
MPSSKADGTGGHDAPGGARAVIGATAAGADRRRFRGRRARGAGARALEGGDPVPSLPEPAVTPAMALFERRPGGLAAAPARPLPRSRRRRFPPGRHALGMQELAPVLESYGIPCAAARPAASPAEAAAAAAALGFPVALKVLSPDISHKSDVGGVRLGLASTAEVAGAAAAMLDAVRAARPQARIEACRPANGASRHGALPAWCGTPSSVPWSWWASGFVGVLETRRGLPTRPPMPGQREPRWRRCSGVRGQAGQPRRLPGICRFAVDAADLVEAEINPLVAGPLGVIAVDARGRM